MAFKNILPILDKGQIWVLPVKPNTQGKGLTICIVTFRYENYYQCIVVDDGGDTSYPVGGYDISVPESEIRKGTQLKPPFSGTDSK